MRLGNYPTKITMKRLFLLQIAIIITVISKAQIIADFETAETTPVISADGNIYSVTDNPDKSGINVSEKVGYYHKLDTNWQYFIMTFPEPVNIGKNNTLTFNVHASMTGRIFAKFWSNGDILIEDWAPEWNFMPTANKWVECTMDLTPAMNKTFDVLPKFTLMISNLAIRMQETAPRLLNSLFPRALLKRAIQLHLMHRHLLTMMVRLIHFNGILAT